MNISAQSFSPNRGGCAKHATAAYTVTNVGGVVIVLVRLLLFGLLGYFAWKIYRSWQATALRGGGVAPPPDAFEPMATCLVCGVHVPRSSLSPSGRCGGCEARTPS